MTLDELDQALLRFGADLRYWPPTQADAARRLAGGDPVAAQRITQFAAFEHTLLEAVRPPPFGAADAARVLAGLDAADSAWRSARWFWIAGASASALSFAAGMLAMLAIGPAPADFELPLSVIELAAGQGDLGDLL